MTPLTQTPDPLATQSTPPCPHFGPCGGCQLQHLRYAEQLAQKSARLRDSLTAAGLILPEIQTHASPPLAYRNRIRLTLREANTRLLAGYLTSPAGYPTSGVSDVGSKPIAPSAAHPAFVPITQCPISAPILWRTAEALLALLNERGPTWVERAHFTLDQLELFTTADESQLQFSLFARTSAKSLPARFTAEFASLCEALREHIPALTGAGIYLLPARSNQSRRTEQPRPGPAWGTPGLHYAVASTSRSDAENQSAQDEVVIRSAAKNPRISPLPPQLTTYWVPRGAFFQTNRFLLPALLALVTEGRSGALAWDLYAGVGLFTSALAPKFARITAVEIAEPAFTALASTRVSNRHAVKSTTLNFLESAVIQRDRPDLIVLDPPRTGAGAEVCELLGRIAAPTVAYVSCSPETLPADLATLTAAGYRIADLHLLDLFPQTTHIETVAILTR